jgi:hypothetical protein
MTVLLIRSLSVFDDRRCSRRRRQLSARDVGQPRLPTYYSAFKSRRPWRRTSACLQVWNLASRKPEHVWFGFAGFFGAFAPMGGRPFLGKMTELRAWALAAQGLNEKWSAICISISHMAAKHFTYISFLGSRLRSLLVSPVPSRLPVARDSFPG